MSDLRLSSKRDTHLYIISNISWTSCWSFSSKTSIILFFARNLGSGYKTTCNGDSYSIWPAAPTEEKHRSPYFHISFHKIQGTQYHKFMTPLPQNTIIRLHCSLFLQSLDSARERMYVCAIGVSDAGSIHVLVHRHVLLILLSFFGGSEMMATLFKQFSISSCEEEKRK